MIYIIKGKYLNYNKFNSCKSNLLEKMLWINTNNDANYISKPLQSDKTERYTDLGYNFKKKKSNN